MKTVALIPAAGMGRRMGASINKQYLLLDGKPVLAHTLELFQQADFIDEIVVVVPAEEIDFCRLQVVEKYGIEKVRHIVAGGAERQNSVLNGLRALDCHDDDVVLIHDGVRPFVPISVVQHSIEMSREHDGALVAVPVKDTVKIVQGAFVKSTPSRNSLWLAQTPQTFRYKTIRAAHELADAEGFSGTDDASLLERIGKKVHVVIGDYRNIKITTPEDLLLAQAFLNDAKGEKQVMRIGHGYDVHRLVAGRKLILGGVEIPHETGLLGHSDADVLLHAICDAILGAIGEGDIGKHFPDSDPAYKGVSSIVLLQQVMRLAEEKGYKTGNIDATIVAQRPRLASFITLMVENISAALGTGPDRINVKATTTEELGFAGREEGIAAYSVALMERG